MIHLISLTYHSDLYFTVQEYRQTCISGHIYEVLIILRITVYFYSAINLFSLCPYSLYQTVLLKSSSHLACFLVHLARMAIGAPVTQWVKCWPTDLAVPSSIPARGEIFSTVNAVPLHTAIHYQPPIVLI